MNTSFDLLAALKNAGYDATLRDTLWWPNSGTFEVLIGAILTQQSKWEKVQVSLQNLESKEYLSLEAMAEIDLDLLTHFIKPSGFYNQKAKNIHRLATNILEEFGDFSSFQENVSREWLLSQKGVGEETADSILCYGCLKEAMVVDSYTNRLVGHYGFEFESYQELQAWLIDGLDEARLEALYGKKLSRAEIYARFHGKIVMFCKENMRGRVLKHGVPGL